MAEQTVLVELQVSSEQAVLNIQKAQDALSLMKQKEQELKQQWEENKITESEYATEMAKCKTVMESQTNIIKANKDALKQNVREEKSAKDSLVSLRAELKKATTAFDNLSKAEREGAQGKELQHHITVLTDEISNAEQATGRFQRNVGNYKGSIVSAFSSIGGAAGGKMAQGITAATGALKIMSATPVIAILGLLVNIISKVIEGFKNSEIATNRLSKAMSGFKVIGNAVSKVIEGLSVAISWVVEKMGDLAAKLAGAEDKLKEAKRLQEEEIELTEEERQMKVEEAKTEKEVAIARYNAADATKTKAERAKEAARAEDLLTKKYEQQVAYLRKVKDHMQAVADQAPNNKEANDKLAEATANLSQAEAEMWNRRKEIMTQQNRLISGNTQLKKSYEDLNKAIKEQEAEWTLTQDNRIRLMQLNGATEEEILRQRILIAEEEIKKLEMYEGESAEAYTKRALDAEENYLNANKAFMDYINEQMQQESDEWLEQRNKEIKKDDEVDASHKALAERTRNNYIAMAKGVADTFGGLSDIMSQFADDSKAAAVADAGIKLAQLYINQAVAISNAVREATAIGFPQNIAAIATSVGAVLAAISGTISTVKSAKEQISQFSTGGYVEGAGTGTSDSISARLSNGESVINAKSTAKYYDLLSAINQDGGGVAFGKTGSRNKFATGGYIDTNALSGSFRTSQMESLVAAISSMQPVVSVREITKAQNKVSLKEKTARA